MAEPVENIQMGQEYRYSDRELATIISQEIDIADGNWQDAISQQRELAYKYYNGTLPKPPENNRSKYVDRTVFDAVETIRSRMLRTFASNRDVCRFTPRSEDDVLMTEAANEYVNYCFNVMNPGYLNLSDVFQDGLIAKLGVMKRYYKTEVKRVYEDFSGTAEQFDALLAQDNYILPPNPQIATTQTEVVQMTELGPVSMVVDMVETEVIRLDDRSRVAVEVVAPELFYLDGRTSERDEIRFVAEKFHATRSELVDMGYDRDLVDRLNYDDNNTVTEDGVQYSRTSFDQTWRDNRGNTNDERTILTVYEAYILIDMDDDGVTEQWQVIQCGDTILEKNRVDDIPYRFWSPYTQAHQLIGYSAADLAIEIQKALTATMRGAQDNVWLTNTTRTIGNLSAVRNPRDLLDNPIGGHIDAPADAIMPLPTPPLNQATFGLIEQLMQAKESRLGVNRLNNGLNQDAVSAQNSDSLIERLMTAGDERIMEMCRGFAEVVLKPLLQDVFRLAVENGVVAVGQINGQQTEIYPDQLEFRDDMEISTALTPDQALQEAQSLLTMGSMLSQDEVIAPQFSEKERTALYYSAMELLGFRARKPYLASPDDPEVQMRKQAAAEAAQQQAAQMEAMQQQMAEFQTQLQILKNVPAMAKLNLEAQTSADAQSLDEAQFEEDKRQFDEELALERQQDRNVSID